MTLNMNETTSAAELEQAQKLQNTLVKRPVVKTRPLHWLARGKIALHSVHILAAAPGAGASCLMTHWAAQLSRGKELLPAHENEKGWASVCYLQLEHDIARIEYNRLTAAGADMGQIVVTPDADLYDLDEELKKMAGLKLLLVDADRAIVDEEQDVTLVKIIRGLATLAQQFRLAVVLVAKLPNSRAAADRRLAEICAISEASVIFALERRGEDRVLRTARNRIGSDEDLLRFRIVPRDLDVEGETAPAVEWLNEPQAGLAAYRFTELEKCIEWVRATAQRGMRSTTLYELALQLHGFSETTVKRALEPAGFKSCMVTGSDRKRVAILLHLFDDPKSVAEGPFFKTDDEDGRKFADYLTV